MARRDASSFPSLPGRGAALGAVLCAALALGGVAQAAPPTAPTAAPAVSTAGVAPVDAVVSYETRHVMASGVTRVDTWQERVVRRGGQVWTERVLPARRHHHESAAEHAAHKHLDAETSAKWLRVNAAGELELKLVDHEHRVTVDVPKAEFGSVSFDGRFDAAASVVPAAVARAMAAQGPATAQGQWRVDRGQGWSHRVLWSESKQMAMRVESQRDDGSFSRRVTVRLLPPGKAAPWDAVGGYEAKRYDDYMD